jgi:membrane protease YdiL (CAAX protease family)
VNLFLADDGRLRAIWRFCLGAVVFVAAEEVGNAAGAVVWRTHVLVAELLVQAISLTILLGGLVFLLVAVDQVESDALPAMGLGWGRRTARQIAAGIGIGCAMALACAAVLMVFAQISFVSTTPGPRMLLRAALALAVLALGAMAEEAAFRGYPFQRLVEAAGPIVAIVVMQICFGLVHRDNPNVSRWGLANTVLFGVLLALAYLRSRALWLPWGIHFGWNAMLAVGLGLPMSGLTLFAAFWHTRVRGPHWMTGGAYGVEGGALATAAITLAIPAVWWAGAKIGESGNGAVWESGNLANREAENPGVAPSTSAPDN